MKLILNKLSNMPNSLELTDIVIDNGDRAIRFEDQNLEGSTRSVTLLSSDIEDGASSGSALNISRVTFEKGFPEFKTLRRYLCFSSLCCREKINDPKGPFLQKWNKIVLISCILALACDPFFLYIPVIDGNRQCLKLDYNLKIISSILRTLIDLFYLLHIIIKFHTGFVAPSTGLLGGRYLITDHAVIAKRYISSYFTVDILAVLPLPQIAVYVIIPSLVGGFLTSEGLLKLVLFTQYIPRLIRIYPLYKEVQRTSGMITETTLAGAAFNLFLYMLASHVVGAVWYMFAIDRQGRCWRKSCIGQGCYHLSLYCNNKHGANYAFNSSYCTPVDPQQIIGSMVFNSGLFYDALRSEVVQSTHILTKLSYCFWWGLRSLSSCGQNLETSSTSFGENLFATLICVAGLSLFALLIGNMQKYLQMLLSIGRIEEEMRERKQVVEHWMFRRSLPEDMKERIRRHEQYIWQETRGVDEESVINNLPRDLRMDIKRHLGLDLIKRVPMFDLMDEQLRDAMCDRLKPVLYTENSYIVREGDLVNEMLFIVRGIVLCTTTNGGRTEFFNVILEAGDFYGDVLLTWALDDPNTSFNLPISTRTLLSRTEVEIFALTPDDLKFLASQYRRRYNKQLRPMFRFYSPQWRTWATCVIQAAWRRYYRRKRYKSLLEAVQHTMGKGGSSHSLGSAIYASRFAVNISGNLRRNIPKNARIPHRRTPLLNLQKPAEPDFTSKDD